MDVSGLITMIVPMLMIMPMRALVRVLVPLPAIVRMLMIAPMRRLVRVLMVVLVTVRMVVPVVLAVLLAMVELLAIVELYAMVMVMVGLLAVLVLLAMVELLAVVELWAMVMVVTIPATVVAPMLVLPVHAAIVSRDRIRRRGSRRRTPTGSRPPRRFGPLGRGGGPLPQQRTFAVGRGEVGGLGQDLGRLRVATQALQDVGAHRTVEVVAPQAGVVGDRVEHSQGGGRAVGVQERDRAVQLHDRGGGHLGQRLVEGRDRLPVRLGEADRAGMTSGDRRLQRVGTQRSLQADGPVERG